MSFITGACGLTGRSGKFNHTPFLPADMKPLCEPPFPLEHIRKMTALMAGNWHIIFLGGRNELKFVREMLCQ